MTFAFTIEYFRATIVLGSSIKTHSQHDLIVVVPVSMIKEKKLSLADIARAQKYVKQVILVNDDDKNHPAHHLCHSFGSKVYLKFLAFNFIEYDKVVVVDADSFVLSSKVDLLFFGKESSTFIGVGVGIMPGSLFLVKPNIKVMQIIIDSLRKHHNYRLNEMGFFNVVFGAGLEIQHNGKITKNKINNSIIESLERLPASASCTVMNQISYSKCVTFDMAYCNEKPWSIIQQNTSKLVCGRKDIDTKDHVKVDIMFTKAVKDWWEIHNSLTVNKDIKKRLNTTSKPPLCMKKIRTTEDVNDEIIFHIQLCDSRNVCIRAKNALTCNKHGQGTVSIKVKKVTESHGDHRIILYCMTDKQRTSLGLSTITHQLLLHVSANCGKLEHSYNISPNMLDFVDAQKYVSGGGVDMALKKWEHSGKSQMNVLISAGFQSYHSILECK
jgi:lipopolysaccharide biosynthesis glycosyltransferase